MHQTYRAPSERASGVVPRYSELSALVLTYPNSERVWAAVRWAAARDPIRSSIETIDGIRARTTLGMWGVPPLVWFFIEDEGLREAEFVGVCQSVVNDDF